MTTPIPPGWYPDGHGNTRYWNGSTWADQAQPAPAAPHRAPAGNPWWKAGWVLPVGVGVVALLIGLGAGAGTKPKAKTIAGPTVTNTATATATSTITTTPTVVKTIATKVLTHTVTFTPPVQVAFSDGTFRVNSEIKPGTYHAVPGPAGCYYERSNKGSGIDAIIVNDNITGPTTIDIAPSDYSFKSSGGCDWVRIG